MQNECTHADYYVPQRCATVLSKRESTNKDSHPNATLVAIHANVFFLFGQLQRFLHVVHEMTLPAYKFYDA